MCSIYSMIVKVGCQKVYMPKHVWIRLCRNWCRKLKLMLKAETGAESRNWCQKLKLMPKFQIYAKTLNICWNVGSTVKSQKTKSWKIQNPKPLGRIICNMSQVFGILYLSGFSFNFWHQFRLSASVSAFGISFGFQHQF